MADHRDDNKPAESGENRSMTGGGTSSQARRRFLKGTGVGAPVLMTVLSRPVFGAACSPSGFTSGNLSDHGHNDCAPGYTPGGYKTVDQGDGSWMMTPYIPGGCMKRDMDGNCVERYTSQRGEGTKVLDAFGDFGGVYSRQFDGLTMLEVLWLPQSMMHTGDERDDPHEFGAHIIAALLNIYTIENYGLEEWQVKAIWKQVEQLGYYETTNGFKMYPMDVVGYLQQTMV